jgi:hypothetical protein
MIRHLRFVDTQNESVRGPSVPIQYDQTVFMNRISMIGYLGTIEDRVVAMNTNRTMILRDRERNIFAVDLFTAT